MHDMTSDATKPLQFWNSSWKCSTDQICNHNISNINYTYVQIECLVEFDDPAKVKSLHTK